MKTEFYYRKGNEATILTTKQANNLLKYFGHTITTKSLKLYQKTTFVDLDKKGSEIEESKFTLTRVSAIS